MAPLSQDTGTGRWVRARTGMHAHIIQESTQRWKKKMGFNRDLLLQQPYVSPAGLRFSCQVQETHLLTQREGVTSFQHHHDTNKNL